MDRLDAMNAFVVAIDEGTLAAAARRLSYSPAAVTRAITSLEDRVGAQLLHRTTRALRLTSFGESYLAMCRQVLSEIDVAERGAPAERDTPRGLLTVPAPVLFGRLRVRPVLDQFLNAHPAVQARLVLLDRVVSLIDEGIDVAARLAQLPDSNLIATHLGEVRRVLCASPAYLERSGTPSTPGDLSEHACIMSSEAATGPWSFAHAPASRRPGLQAASIHPRLVVNAAAAAIDSALDGHGITRVMSYQVAADVAAGRLKLILERYEPSPIPVHFVMQASRSVNAKLRAFIDFAAPSLRVELARAADLIRTSPPPAVANLAIPTSRRSLRR